MSVTTGGRVSWLPGGQDANNKALTVRLQAYTSVYMMTEQKSAVVPVRIPQELLRKLDTIAKQEDRSRNYVIRELLKQAIEAKRKGGKE